MLGKLKPCPFCGSDRIIVRKTTYDPNGCCENEAFIQCQNCGCSSKTVREHEQMGIVSAWACEAWNRRAERTCGEWRGYSPPNPSGFNDDDSELWCERCDIELDEDWAYCPSCGAKVVDE